MTTCINAFGFELIAHRGVHQTYSRENLDDQTCTAIKIEKSEHRFLENTTTSIKRAFELGATMVEFDIHPTKEADGLEDKMVVFHDWTLDCRTEAQCETGCQCENGSCITHLQPLSYLKSLDIGYGYSWDDGKTFPFRGKLLEQMPTLEEVLDLLAEYPDKKLLVNLKDRFPRTIEIFLRIAEKYPLEIRNRIYFEYYGLEEKRFTDLGIKEAIYQGGGPTRKCLKNYLLYGWTGYFPTACRNTKFFVPLHERLGRFGKFLDRFKAIDFLWGWPNKFIQRANQHGTSVYVSQVDNEEDLEMVIKLPIAGIMTNKIELIAPMIKNYNR